MPSRNVLVRRAATLALIAGALSPAALARQDAKPQPKPVQTMLLVERAGLDSLFPAPKDQALVNALAMFPDRLRELRSQVVEFQQMPPEVIDLIEQLLARPARIAVTNKGFDEQTGLPGIGAVISFQMDSEDAARTVHTSLEKLRSQGQFPFTPTDSTRFPGMRDLPLPFGVMSYGPRKADSGWRYEMIFAAIDDPDAPFKALPDAPAGTSPVFRGSVDLAAWSPLVSMFAGFVAMASPEGQQALEQFKSRGLLGPDAIAFDASVGYADKEQRGSFTIRRAAGHAAALGLSRQTINDDDLAVIPADASFVTVSKSDVDERWAQIRQQAGPAAAQFDAILAQVREATGIDIEKDVIPALGNTTAFYFADSTGGGSILSGVALLSLRDVPRMNSLLNSLSTRANAFLRQQVPPPAAVEVARFEHAGSSFAQLRFPGLPIPVEPTLAIAGNWLVVGASPAAATAAAQHVNAAGRIAGIASSAAFKAGRWSLPASAAPTKISFIDTERTMRDGYVATTFLGSLVSNLVRSRSDAAQPREPGMVTPTFASLREGVRPMFVQTYWAGEDFVTEWRSDPSLLVNIAGGLGVGDALPLITGMVMGGALGTAISNEMQGNFPADHDHMPPPSAEEEAHSEEDEEPAPAGNVPY
ncbi:MAG: hypothetical protein SFZ24_11605 [Planctomycetota bacterium]|nr:hypothetical protein [Planctomycetota bacterium]